MKYTILRAAIVLVSMLGFIMPLDATLAARSDDRRAERNERVSAHDDRTDSRRALLDERFERTNERIQERMRSLQDRLCSRFARLEERFGGRITAPDFCIGNGNGNGSDTKPTLELSATPSVIDSGESSLLEWDADYADSCTASSGWIGEKSMEGSLTVTPAQTTTYVLSCEGDGGTVERSVTVTVDAVSPLQPTVALTADPTDVEEGSTSTLTWTSENATACEASGASDFSGTQTPAGSTDVTVSATTTYTMICGNGMSSSTATATVSVIPGSLPEPSPSVTLTADPTDVEEGSTSTLTWESENATACIASGATDWTGTQTLDGNEEVTVDATTTYTIACGNGTATATDSVTVNVTVPQGDLPTVNLSALPLSVTEGSTSTLSWTTSNADSCQASVGWTGTRATSGEAIVTVNSTTTYELECENEFGTTSDSVEVVVTESSQPAETMLLSEFVFNPAGSEPANEWFELYNGTDAPVDLMNWTIADATSSDLIATSSKIIPVGGYVVITSSSTLAEALRQGGVDAITATSSIGFNGLGNDGDALFLRNHEGELVDAVSWGNNSTAFSPALSLSGVSEGESFARVPVTEDTDTAADWEVLTTPTPGS